MVQQYPPTLDSSFAALADPTRRGVLERLGSGDHSISDLAATFGMTLTGMKKHVSVLERAGFVATRKVGRVRTCGLGARRLEQEAAWIDQLRQTWDARFAALDSVIADLQKEKTNEHG
ncbi:ArsR/SmtB family transcription factor [Novosphingobium aquiterrae]|uniref:ArsR/SmtB family transcription factor n=1 Tax=Novosphingobium aquiterrae TaxID=624388 RepID=A0ABV6PK03_9SPHN